MKPLHKRLVRLGVALGAAALCWACNAPFIPVPPPGETATFTSALVADGNGAQKTVWIAHGPANKNMASSRVYVFDKTISAGVIAEAAADGSYTSPPMDGTKGDVVAISYETPAGSLSGTLCVQLDDQSDVTPDGPSAPILPVTRCEP
jgi:hypothetical protein